jgi:hypothetical protein
MHALQLFRKPNDTGDPLLFPRGGPSELVVIWRRVLKRELWDITATQWVKCGALAYKPQLSIVPEIFSSSLLLDF